MKICSICKEPKDESFFNKNKSKKDGLQNSCRDCRKSNWKKEYQDNKKHYLEKRKIQDKNGRKRLKDFKENLKCILCSEDSKCCLEFHHLDPKKKDFNLANSVYYSDKKFFDETKKCICVCSNCHRKIHNKEITYPRMPLDYESRES